jgi:dCMP deaminase
MTRPTEDEYFLRMAELVSTRSTCLRRAVGAVAVNARGHVMATGRNGPPSGFPHCNEGHPCAGATAPSGTALDTCDAVHAEINLLAQCHDVYAIDRVYLTCSPCVPCIKSLISTSCQRLVFREFYPHREALLLWERARRRWERLPTDPSQATVWEP